MSAYAYALVKPALNISADTSAAYAHGQIVDAELTNQSARFTLVML